MLCAVHSAMHCKTHSLIQFNSRPFDGYVLSLTDQHILIICTLISRFQSSLDELSESLLRNDSVSDETVSNDMRRHMKQCPPECNSGWKCCQKNVRWPFLNFKQNTHTHKLCLPSIVNERFFWEILFNDIRNEEEEASEPNWYLCLNAVIYETARLALSHANRRFFFFFFICCFAVRSSDLNLMRLAFERHCVVNAATTTMLTVTTRRVNRISLHVTHVQNLFTKFTQFSIFPNFLWM